MNYLPHLSQVKLRQFRQLIERQWRDPLGSQSLAEAQAMQADRKVLYTLVCFEVLRRKEAQARHNASLRVERRVERQET